MLTERRHYKGIMLFQVVEMVEEVEEKWTQCLANIASNNICVSVKFILEDLLAKLA